MSGTSEKKQAEKLAQQIEEEEKAAASKKSKKEAKKHVPVPETKEKTRWINISSDFERLKFLPNIFVIFSLISIIKR